MGIIKPVALAVLAVVAGVLIIEAIRLLILKQNVTVYKKYWGQQKAQTVSPDSVLYVALGDSTAQGIGASKPTKGYVGLVANHIAKTTGWPVHSINLSLSGAKVADVIKDQLPSLQDMQLPAGSIITLGIGANDMNAFEPDKFSTQIDRLFRALPPQTIVADIPYFGGGRKRNLETRVLAANEIITKLAKKYNLRLAPLHQLTEENDGILTMSADFLHPSDRGYVNWCRAFAETLKQ